MHDLALDEFTDHWPTADIYRLRRAARDLYSRAARSAFISVPASVIFMLSIGSPRDLPWMAWIPGLLYAALGILRLRNKPPQDGADGQAYRSWRLRQWILIDCGCLLWSGHLMLAALLGPPYSLAVLIALLSTVASGSVICQSFAMDRRAAFLAQSCLTLPGIVAFATHWHGGVMVSLALLMQTGYSTLLLDRAGRDYDTQIATEHALMLSRAETERLVRTDALTGMANRREYERRFDHAWHVAARAGNDLALIVLDLDNFKQLNDTYGHAAGDACLRHFAAVISRHFRRAGDLSARIGGEEFAVILPGLTAADATLLGEAFGQELAESRCVYQGQEIQVTASIGAGAADWRLDQDPIATFARVDQACYEAKKQGRSRLVSA